MEGNWVIEVLRDLAAFAEGNGLPKTAESIEKTGIIAFLEIPMGAPTFRIPAQSEQTNVIPFQKVC